MNRDIAPPPLPVVPLAALEKNLTDASNELLKAQERRDQAYRDVTNATNRVNSAQKEFDAAVVTIRKKADPGTDWGRGNAPKVPE